MRSGSAFSLCYSILFLLILCSGMSYAQQPSFASNASKTILDKATRQMPRFAPTLSLFKESELSAIENAPLSINGASNNQQLEELFAIDEMKHLQQKIDLRFQTGLYSLKNNYVLSNHHATLLSKQLLALTLSQHELYQFGRFRTETGYSRASNINQHSFKAFLHSAYSVINKGRFDISVTASIESIKSTPSFINIESRLQPAVYTANNEQSTSATIGLIGSFDLSNHWSLIGAVTTSHLTSEKNNTLLREEKAQKMALIGTTYSF